MRIHSADFMVGAASPAQFPSSFLPEVAFAGKSNVGKSSVINAFLNRKKLVKISGTPGKTRQINFFLINGTFRLVDLPGYGFSRVSAGERAGWEKLIETYLRDRQFLKGVVLIVDARHPPGELDKTMIDWLKAFRIECLVVANKIDKLKKSQIPGHLKTVREGLALPGGAIPFSAKTKAGRDELAGRLAEWLPEQPGQAAGAP